MSCALPLFSLPPIYKPSLISITFVLSKIWPRQTSIMKNTWLIEGHLSILLCVIFMCAINVLYILCNKYMLCYVMLCLFDSVDGDTVWSMQDLSIRGSDNYVEKTVHDCGHNKSDTVQFDTGFQK